MLLLIELCVVYLSITHVYGCVTGDEKPDNCVLFNSESASEDNINIIKDAMISGDSNRTVAIGEDAEFNYVISKDLLFKPYINGCYSSVCSTNQTNLTCSFNNVQLSDNNTELSVYVFNNYGEAVCFNSSYLFVQDPHDLPVPKVTRQRMNCNEICVDVLYDDNTNIHYVLFQDGRSISIGTSNKTYVCFPKNMFTNHSGLYWVSLNAVSLFGRSNSTNVTILLNKTGTWNVSKMNVSVIDGDFYVVAVIEHFYNDCPSTVLLSSNCSDNNISINVPPLYGGNLSKAGIGMQPEKQKCEVTVADDGHWETKIVQGTFHVNDVKVVLKKDIVNIICKFTLGSKANGCYTEVNDTLVQKYLPYNAATNKAEGVIRLRSNGTYQLHIYDWIGDSRGLLSVYTKTIIVVVEPSHPVNELSNYVLVYATSFIGLLLYIVSGISFLILVAIFLKKRSNNEHQKNKSKSINV